MIEVLSILRLLSSTFIQGFLLRYITLSYYICLKNVRLSKFDENIGILLVNIMIYIFGLHMHIVPQN